MFAVGIISPIKAVADIYKTEDGIFRLYSDLRIRYESDWNSQRSDGTERDNRDRLRVRARFASELKLHEHLTFGIRIRTGPKDSQQSPHITILDFDDNPVGDRDILFDKWFTKYSTGRFLIWGGRNGFPFWKQNELFWDDDVTPAGVALGYEYPDEINQFNLTAGYFALPVGGTGFNGNLSAMQITYGRKLDDLDLTFSGGVFNFDGGSVADELRNNNSSRDYTIWQVNSQLRFNWKNMPVTLGLDLLHNSTDYPENDADKFTAANHNQTEGYVLSAAW